MHTTRLDSWKSIADHLQRSTRTVQRWHVNHGLPVHRFPGLKGAVFAYSEEIDAWLAGFSAKDGDGYLKKNEAIVETKKRSHKLAVKADTTQFLESS